MGDSAARLHAVERTDEHPVPRSGNTRVEHVFVSRERAHGDSAGGSEMVQRGRFIIRFVRKPSHTVLSAFDASFGSGLQACVLECRVAILRLCGTVLSVRRIPKQPGDYKPASGALNGGGPDASAGSVTAADLAKARACRSNGPSCPA